ncbi:MAG: DUF4956 domain-containing protein [Clostridia bacterium]|nr:DUF4956 domain-containing protein [Clostridia bacterium]
MFNTILKPGYITPTEVFICLGVALAVGIAFAFMCKFRSTSTQSFLISTALIPVGVALVIILVNGQVGTGIAIAGAFSLVRFRSAPGTAKEISIIFISMAGGLAFGTGYLAFGIIFVLGAGLALILLQMLRVWERRPEIKDKRVRVVMPEDLDYTTVLDDIFEKYAVTHDIMRVKTVNMGSMFRVDYHIIIKDPKQEKAMVDEIRCRNGNLEVSVQRTDLIGSEL